MHFTDANFMYIDAPMRIISDEGEEKKEEETKTRRRRRVKAHIHRHIRMPQVVFYKIDEVIYLCLFNEKKHIVIAFKILKS